MLVHFDKPASAKEIKDSLESNDPNTKVQGMQKAIMMLLNGEALPALFITILQYVLPSQDHTIQKLLLLYLVCSRPAIRPVVCFPTLGRPWLRLYKVVLELMYHPAFVKSTSSMSLSCWSLRLNIVQSFL